VKGQSLKPKVQSLKSRDCRWRALRPSAFRIWTILCVLGLLAPQALFAAATNSLDPDAIPPLRPPHAEIPPTFWDQYSAWIILGGVLLLALFCVAAWFLTRPKPPVIVPPEAQARQALEPLRQQPEDGVLLSHVSQILRHYVTAAFNLPPGELTTAEFCRVIAGHGPIGNELSAALNDFLRQCDQRKFSPPPPAPPLSAVAQSLKLIDQAQARRLALAQLAAQPPQNSVASPPKQA
jgi:hypothetical protein